MKRNPSQPGPVGTSCLTCKRRRKKCDKERPSCQRCVNSGFFCLGYSHLEPVLPASDLEGFMEDLGDTSLPRADTSYLETTEHPYHNGVPQPQNNHLFLSPLDVAEIDRTSPLHLGTSRIVTDYRSDPSYSCHISGHAGPLLPLDHSFVEVNTSFASTTYRTTVVCCPVPAAISQRYRTAMRSAISVPSPSSTYLKPDSTGPTFDFILTQHERLVRMAYFRPTNKQVVHVRDLLIGRMEYFRTARLVLLLGCKMIESFLEGTAAQTLPGYINWLTRFDKQLDLTAESNPDPARLLDRLLSALQVTFLKLKLFDGLHAYKLLKQSAPAFLRIASTDIGLSLSPQNIIVSDHYELGQFMLLDSLCAMIYAVPQIIQYDISDPSLLQPSFNPNEWVHGCPIILQLVLVDINSLLDRKRAGGVVDWKAVEYRLISWQPASSQISVDTEPHKRVTYFAAQECWRHTLMIYLLMAVGGVASDNPHVQNSVRHVFQLMTILDRSDGPLLYIHLVIPYIIAGACAQREKHRATARERLQDVFNNSLWTLRGSDFIPLLDCIWHGVAADGRPIVWEDYVRARQAKLPIDI